MPFVNVITNISVSNYVYVYCVIIFEKNIIIQKSLANQILFNLLLFMYYHTHKIVISMCISIQFITSFITNYTMSCISFALHCALHLNLNNCHFMCGGLKYCIYSTAPIKLLMSYSYVVMCYDNT